MTEPSDSSSNKPESPEGTEETPSTTVTDDHPEPPKVDQPGTQPSAYPPPSGWGQPPIGFTQAPVAPKNGLGIASLVIAIIALMFVWSVVGGIIAGIIAAVLGIVARGRVKRGQANNGGVAIAGIVLGVLAIIISLAFIAIWAGFWQFSGGADYVDCMQSAGSDPDRQQQCADEFRQTIEEKLSVTVTTAPSP